MPRKIYILQIIICAILLSAIILIESFSNLDLWLQKLWFDQSTGSWLISKTDHQKYRWLFYSGAKKAISVSSGICGAFLLAGLLQKKRRRLIRPGLLLLLSLMIIPATVNCGKKYTNIHCPYDLVEFGGAFEYQRVLECPRPENLDKENGRCFPAAHASGGFALMALYFCLPKRWRWLGLGVGFTAGWVMGNYQMLRGDHFLSHTLVTMVLAWLIILLLLPLTHKLTDWYLRKRNWPPESACLP